MLAYLCLAVLCGQEPEAKPAEPTTPTVFCALAYERRLATIAAIQAQLDELPKKNDYTKLSAEAKKKLEKPFKDQISAVRQNREVDWNVRLPDGAQMGEVFKFPRTNPKFAVNDQYGLQHVIDKKNIIAVRAEEAEVSQKVGTRIKKVKVPKETFLVIQGLKATEFTEKFRYPIKLSGLWVRIEDLKHDDKTHMRVARWPHENDVKAMWPQFLKDREEEATAESIEKRKAADKKP